jgi:hypothetical protein
MRYEVWKCKDDGIFLVFDKKRGVGIDLIPEMNYSEIIVAFKELDYSINNYIDLLLCTGEYQYEITSLKYFLYNSDYKSTFKSDAELFAKYDINKGII